MKLGQKPPSMDVVSIWSQRHAWNQPQAQFFVLGFSFTMRSTPRPTSMYFMMKKTLNFDLSSSSSLISDDGCTWSLFRCQHTPTYISAILKLWSDCFEFSKCVTIYLYLSHCMLKEFSGILLEIRFAGNFTYWMVNNNNSEEKTDMPKKGRQRWYFSNFR